MSGYYNVHAEADADADRESSAASSLVFTSDEEGDERADSTFPREQTYEVPSQAGRRHGSSSRSASSISARSSAPASAASRGSSRSPLLEERPHTRSRHSSSSIASSPSPSSSSSSSVRSARHTRKAQRVRAADVPAFPDSVPSLSSLLPQNLFASAAAPSSISSTALPPARIVQALHYFEAALRCGQKRSREQAESVLRRQKRRAAQAAAAAAGKGQRGKGRGSKGRKRHAGGENGIGEAVSAVEVEMLDEDGEGVVHKPRAEVSWIEEEAKLWIRALNADRPRQRSNSQSGSTPRLYGALSSSQRQSQSGGMGSQQQRGPLAASRVDGALSAGQQSQLDRMREGPRQVQPSAASQGRRFARYGPRGR